MAQDPQYEQVRKIWNASIGKRPLVMAGAKDAGDVAKALQFARESALLVAIRGGGHNVGGRALCDGGLVVDLSLMRGVSVDPATRTVTVQGGATLGDLD